MTKKYIMKEQTKNTGTEDQTKKQPDTAIEQSSVDRKNEEAIHRTPTATERVRPRAGDGLANEGTNVSYDQER
jgi:hypothetical protein